MKNFINMIEVIIGISWPFVLLFIIINFKTLKEKYECMKLKKQAQRRKQQYLDKVKVKYNSFTLNEKANIYKELLKIKAEHAKLRNRNAAGDALIQTIMAPENIKSIILEIRKKYKIDVLESYYELDLEYLKSEFNKERIK